MNPYRDICRDREQCIGIYVFTCVYKSQYFIQSGWLRVLLRVIVNKIRATPLVNTPSVREFRINGKMAHTTVKCLTYRLRSSISKWYDLSFEWVISSKIWYFFAVIDHEFQVKCHRSITCACNIKPGAIIVTASCYTYKSTAILLIHW